MKRINVILIMASVLALVSCGLADPWKTWENEGELPSDRLLPSDLKETLCLADWWKCSYGSEDFYFQFIDDGTVESNSTLLRDAESTTYYINWEEPYSLLLTVVGGGHFSYLSSGKEETLVVTAFDDAEIKCKGSESGAEITFVPATSSDVNKMVAAKADEYKKMEVAEKIVNAGMTTGAIWASGTLVAHYYVDLSEYKAYTARFDILENNVLTHKTVSVTVGLDSRINLASAISVAGKPIQSIALDTESKSVSAGSGFTASVSNSGSWYIGNDYRTYVFRSPSSDSRCGGCDAIVSEFNAQSDKFASIELSDRGGRPFFTIPNNWDDGRGYVAIYSNSAPYVDSKEADKVYFSNGSRQEMPYGGDSKWISWTMENYPAIIGTYFNEEGVIIIKDGDQTIWLLSPVNGNWFKAAK